MVIVFTISFVVPGMVSMRIEIHKDGEEICVVNHHAATCFSSLYWVQPEKICTYMGSGAQFFSTLLLIFLLSAQPGKERDD